MWQRFWLCDTNRGLTWESYSDLCQLTCVTMSETTPEDLLIILREFLAGNKAHAKSDSIRAQVNCSRVRVNCSRASVNLHLSCTVLSSNITTSNFFRYTVAMSWGDIKTYTIWREPWKMLIFMYLVKNHPIANF